MQEVIEQIEETDKLLHEVAKSNQRPRRSPFLRTTINLARIRLEFARLMLQRLQERKEETCEKS